MDLNKFLKEHRIPESDQGDVASDDSDECMKLQCALRYHTKHSLFFELHGTVYEVSKEDVVSVDAATAPVVTRSGAGEPVLLWLKPTAELTSSRRIAASDLERDIPFVLRRPSDADNISHQGPCDMQEAEWLGDRGITMDLGSSLATNTQSFSNPTFPR